MTCTLFQLWFDSLAHDVSFHFMTACCFSTWPSLRVHRTGIWISSLDIVLRVISEDNLDHVAVRVVQRHLCQAESSSSAQSRVELFFPLCRGLESLVPSSSLHEAVWFSSLSRMHTLKSGNILVYSLWSMRGALQPLVLSPKPCYQGRDVTADFPVPMTGGA